MEIVIDSYIIGGVKYIDSTCVATFMGNYYQCQIPPNPSYPFFFIHENLNRAIVKNFNNDIIMFGTIGNNTWKEISGIVIKFDSVRK